MEYLPPPPPFSALACTHAQLTLETTDQAAFEIPCWWEPWGEIWKGTSHWAQALRLHQVSKEPVSAPAGSERCEDLKHPFTLSKDVTSELSSEEVFGFSKPSKAKRQNHLCTELN